MYEGLELTKRSVDILLMCLCCDIPIVGLDLIIVPAVEKRRSKERIRVLRVVMLMPILKSKVIGPIQTNGLKKIVNENHCKNPLRSTLL